MGPFWAQKFKNSNLTKSFIKMFLKFFATIGIQNEAKVTVFSIFRRTLIMPKEPLFRRFWLQN